MRASHRFLLRVPPLTFANLILLVFVLEALMSWIPPPLPGRCLCVGLLPRVAPALRGLYAWLQPLAPLGPGMGGGVSLVC